MAEKIYEKIERLINEAHIMAEIEELSIENKKCVIMLEWGDWKHSHIRMDAIMCTNFEIKSCSTCVTEEDGSDCYSARHIYYFGNI